MTPSESDSDQEKAFGHHSKILLAEEVGSKIAWPLLKIERTIVSSFD
ncbi:uncharacterized protein METZ01_LOCUS148845 [marine metagenome]|uniref:Uncharacterized protein n=1 Tax=marine metagenome TaxID=408172 RepID=A0A382A428_9ZZZZ